jgi:hypothetical protein
MIGRRIALAAFLVTLLPGIAIAADDPAVIPLRIAVGDAAPVGPPPVRNLVCDDATLVKPVEIDGAPALRAVRVGTTLCSLTDSLSVRRTYRVVVYDPAVGPGDAAPAGRR